MRIGEVSIQQERATSKPILSIDKLSLFVHRDDGARLKIVEDVSFRILPGQFFALVGESGSGKTMIARAIMRLLPDALLEIDGAIRFGAHELAQADERTLRPLRGSEIAMIFQEPMSSLNPLMTVERQLTEAMAAHGTHKGRNRRAHIIDLLRRVRFREPMQILRAYPHELSGGMRQRVMIANALINEPKLLIADEPTTALDVTIQRQVLDIIASLARSYGLAVLFISHDLSLVYENADEVAVLYGGVLMERGPARDVIERPMHPYTAALLACVPHRRNGLRQVGIEGSVPSVADWQPGCRFVSRCRQTQAQCRSTAIQVIDRGDRSVRCVMPLNGNEPPQ
jgi:oligopeptide/dipeptide ABC transporter ATP-binding protein